MADTKISELTAATALSGADTLVIVQGGTTKKLAASASLLIVVDHGAVASTARPTSAASVLWKGTVEPTNMTDDDLWLDQS